MYVARVEALQSVLARQHPQESKPHHCRSSRFQHQIAATAMPSGAKRKAPVKGKESDQEEDKPKPAKKGKASATPKADEKASEPSSDDQKDAAKPGDQGKARKATQNVNYKEGSQFRTRKSDMVVCEDEAIAADEAEALKDTAAEKAGIKRRWAARSFLLCCSPLC
jgi:hypothetical protein